LGGWDIELFDRLLASQRGFGAGANYVLFFGGQEFDEEDRAGRYVFRDSGQGVGSGTGGSTWQTPGLDLMVVGNEVGASVGRLLPTETLFQFGFSHVDYFYPENPGGQLPGSRDRGYVTLVSQRETLRFKPFANYRFAKYGDQDNWDQSVNGGIAGPVTENLHFLGQAGYFMPGEEGGGHLFWHVRLRHNPNPLTYQELGYVRSTTEPDRELHETWYYRLRHTFRPDLFGDLWASRSVFESLGRSSVRTGEEDRVGLHFTYNPSQRTTLAAGGAYTRITYEDPAFIGSENWIAYAQIGRELGKSFSAWLSYNYRERNAFTPGNSYYENLVMLTLARSL